MTMLGQLACLRLGSLWPAGPILDKELRVASRRRRLYVLRFVYVCLLAAFAGLCVTLSAAVLGGSLRLLSSISSRDSYHAVLTVGLWYLVIWGLVPMLLGWPSRLLRPGSTWVSGCFSCDGALRAFAEMFPEETPWV